MFALRASLTLDDVGARRPSRHLSGSTSRSGFGVPKSGPLLPGETL